MTQNNENKERDTLAAFAGLVILIAALAILFGITSPNTGNKDDVVVGEVATEEAVVSEVATEEAVVSEVATEEAIADTTAAVAYDPALVATGETFFVTCAGCHGMDARGLPGVGKDLVASEFVHGLSDDELVAFITVGRPVWDPANTTSIDMPPKGGNPAFSTEDLYAIVAYIRTLGADVASSEETSANTAIPETGDTAAVAYDPALVATGETFFVTCAGCHGMDARGLPGVGKDLVASEFVGGLSDDELVAFITVGRPVWDPANTTSIDMPPKGGNPAFSTEDLYAIVAYIRTLGTSAE